MPQTLDFDSFFETYKSAVLNKEVDTLMALYGEDFIAFDMWGPWSYAGEGPWREMNQGWLESLGSESVVVEFDDIITVSGGDIAAAYATVTYKAVSETGAVLRSMQNRLTWVAKPKDGAWKIVHQHTSAPIDPGTMSAILRREAGPNKDPSRLS
jgi:ketosteroid isomerase-like protein